MIELGVKFAAEMLTLLEGEVPAKLAVAVSGGADSMALCHLTQQFAVAHGCFVEAVVVDHQLRKNSTQEATATLEFLAQQGIVGTILTWHGKKPTSNIQAVARRARYHLLGQYCKQHGISHCLTAHHMDDQAETVLMNIMRGSGLNGICGISKRNIIEGVTILRPLLHCSSKQELLDYLLKHNWWHCQDPSNDCQEFTRVRVRKLLQLTELAGLGNRLQLLASNARRTRNYLDKQTKQFLKQACVWGEFGNAKIDVRQLAAADEEIALRSLSIILMRVGGKTHPSRLQVLVKALQEIKDENCRGITLSGCYLRKEGKTISVLREASALPPAIKFSNQDHTLQWDGRFMVKLKQAGYLSTININQYQQLKKSCAMPPWIIAKTLPAFFAEDGTLLLFCNLYRAPKCAKANVIFLL